MKSLALAVLPALLFVATAFAGDNLKLNSRLDYSSDSQDGALITGDNMESGFIAGKPAYVILYEKYKDRVQFVVIDLDHDLSRAQQDLKKKYYRGYIPHVVVLDASGAALHNSSGEVEESVISQFLDKAAK